VGQYENLTLASQHCQTDAGYFSVETRHCIICLESWLNENQRKDPDFLARIFLRSGARQRVRTCAHNPAYDPQYRSKCYRRITEHDKNPSSSKRSCDLAEEVRRSNHARAKMMGYEKYDMYIINPLFGTGLQYNASSEVRYFAKGATLRESSSSSSSSSGECWPEKYPLHKAAYDNNVAEIRRLLARGMKVNEMDSASWTPLHYCAFYNNLKSMEDVRDCTGRRPIDVCDCVPKDDYQKVAKLLRAWKRLDKIQVELMDGGNAQLLLSSGQDTTAGQLHAEMCKELKFNEDSGRLFAIWICSDRLSLQLKSEHKILQHMNKWKSKIAKFGSDETDAHDNDAPRIFFRRDARLTLRDEKQVEMTPMALSLLYEECRQNYLSGLYPCSSRDVHSLAAIMLHIIHGSAFQLKLVFYIFLA
ncbi:unnamed protein product, partial [Gongylonema pulchrum]|uniref:FERM domain-containing protein n=1 Tax=Gongylonema pulchrum TaxID=637853 RepID=A0A183EBD8_9BILA